MTSEAVILQVEAPMGSCLFILFRFSTFRPQNALPTHPTESGFQRDEIDALQHRTSAEQRRAQLVALRHAEQRDAAGAARAAQGAAMKAQAMEQQRNALGRMESCRPRALGDGPKLWTLGDGEDVKMEIRWMFHVSLTVLDLWNIEGHCCVLVADR